MDNSILFSAMMRGSCHRTSSWKGCTKKNGFAPWRARATLATGCHLSNIWPRATLWFPPMKGCKQFQTSNCGCWCKTRLLYSGALLRRGAAMPSRHRTCPYPNQRHDIGYQERSQVATREGTAGIARVSLPYGLASETQQRSASCLASRGHASNNRKSQ